MSYRTAALACGVPIGDHTGTVAIAALPTSAVMDWLQEGMPAACAVFARVHRRVERARAGHHRSLPGGAGRTG